MCSRPAQSSGGELRRRAVAATTTRPQLPSPSPFTRHLGPLFSHSCCSMAIGPIVRQLLTCGDAIRAAPHTLARQLQFSAALQLATAVLHDVLRVQLPDAATAVDLASCVQLLLGAGCSVLEHGSATASSPGFWRITLVQQVQLMRGLLLQAWPSGALQRVAAEFFAPPAMCNWLSNIVSEARAVFGTAPGGWKLMACTGRMNALL